MSDQVVKLPSEDANVRRAGKVVIYSWDHHIDPANTARFETGIGLPVLNGGIGQSKAGNHVKPVYICETCPSADGREWFVRAKNTSYFDRVPVTIYVIAWESLPEVPDTTEDPLYAAPLVTFAETDQTGDADGETAGARFVEPAEAGVSAADRLGQDKFGVLEVGDAEVVADGPITRYRWRRTVGHADMADWTTGKLPGLVVSGGLELTDSHQVMLTDNYPAAADQWRVGVINDAGETDVYINATTVTGLPVRITHGDTQIPDLATATISSPALPGTPVGGGIWVHGYYDVRTIGTFPVQKQPDNRWIVQARNLRWGGNPPVAITMFAVELLI